METAMSLTWPVPLTASWNAGYVHVLAGRKPAITGWMLLKKICEASEEGAGPILIYFHNLAYDSRFIVQHISRPQLLESDGRVYSITGTYRFKEKTIPIEIHDTYVRSHFY